MLVVPTYNGVCHKKTHVFEQEPDDLELAMRRFCGNMSRAPKCLLVTGMSAKAFSLDPAWDALVEKCVAICCKMYNVPTVTGKEFFETLSHVKYGEEIDAWHCARDVKQDYKIARFYVDCIDGIQAGLPSSVLGT